MLEVKDATIAIGERCLATGLSFMARDGQLTCITGPAGSGKTTLLRTLMGFLPVEEGFVSVDGELLTTHSAHAFRCFMTYLPQEIQMLAHQLRAPETPVCEADEYGVWNSVLPTATAEQQASQLSPEEIFLLAEQIITSSSDKQIVIADEPAAHLTPELSERMLDLLWRQAKAGKTVLIASRKPQIIAQANQVINLNAFS